MESNEFAARIYCNRETVAYRNMRYKTDHGFGSTLGLKGFQRDAELVLVTYLHRHRLLSFKPNLQGKTNSQKPS